MLTFFDQLVLSDRDAGTYGDCARACICTMLQSDPREWPHSIDDKGHWNDVFFDRLETEGYVMNFRRFGLPCKFPTKIVGLAGLSPRGINHMCLYNLDLKAIIHDPHPSRAGLADFKTIYFLERLS